MTTKAPAAFIAIYSGIGIHIQDNTKTLIMHTKRHTDLIFENSQLLQVQCRHLQLTADPVSHISFQPSTFPPRKYCRSGKEECLRAQSATTALV